VAGTGVGPGDLITAGLAGSHVGLVLLQEVLFSNGF